MNDKLCVTTLRCLALDMIDKANSGHPGMALGSAAILHTIYSRHLTSTAADASWIKRDRFVLSSGHVSSLLYAMLYLTGYDLTMDDLKSFRQLHSKTPGHPEYKVTDGVDISTGPLGQGIANAVGMAMAERHLCALYPNLEHVLEHYTYVLCGDGDLEEGVALEAMSLAGSYRLNKLIVCYDNNDVTLDGPLSQSSIDNVQMKAESMGWNVLFVKDGNDVEEIDKAINEAKNQNEKPTLIICKTIIGYGSAKQGTNAVHGAPLTHEGSKIAKEFFGWDHEDFYVPDEVKDDYNNSYVARGLMAYMQFNKDLDRLSEEDRNDYESILACDVVSKVKDKLPKYIEGYSNATRNVSGELLNIYSDNSTCLFGGSADVAGSVKTALKHKDTFTSDNYYGQNINFGIREHAMCAIANGIVAHGGLRPYVGCFLVFSDYARGALRTAALMGLPVTYLFSHDSIAVGEDGPTHQPIEQLASLRVIPNFNVIRPCDANETAGAYEIAFSSTSTPTAIILSRQNLKTVRGCSKNKVKKGGYVLSYEDERLDAIIIATGSEVNLAVEAQKALKEENIDVRVVSMPSTFLFDKQRNLYKESVLPHSCNTKIAVEMGNGDMWYKYANEVMSIDTFGASGPADQVIEAYKFTKTDLVNAVKKMIAKNK